MPRASLFLVFLLLLLHSAAADADENLGRWKLVRRNAGVSAMHMALLPSGKVVAFDRTTAGPSNLTIPGCPAGHCTAHSIEFDPVLGGVRPLTFATDTFCSSGTLLASGVLVQTGGFKQGERAVRYFRSCLDAACDWTEDTAGLATRRWYASDQLLDDGATAIVLGGRRQFSYEFVPKRSAADAGVFDLPFLRETRHPELENNLYPFLHLAPDGNLFVFANTRAILLDYRRHAVVRQFPELPGNFSRNFPSTGSSVLLPLVLADADQPVPADVLVCGGTPPLSYIDAKKSVFHPATDTCGRLRITDENPQWVVETMPMPRTMGDMVLLPTGDVLIVNGAGRGTAGWGLGRDPVVSPVLYRTGATYSIPNGTSTGGNFQVLAPSGIPRLYHSTANLLPDGRVLVGGSNPNVRYQFQNVTFPTELSMEAFYPPYMNATGRRRPKIVTFEPAAEGGEYDLWYGERARVVFWRRGEGQVMVTAVAPAFSTHSFSMNQRVVVLRVLAVRCIAGDIWAVDVEGPPRPAVAPPGYYLLFVVHGGLPSKGTWIRIR